MALYNLTKRTQGRDFNFFKKFSVTSTTFGTGALSDQPDGIITFPTSGIIFSNETAGQVVEVSFNGNTVHCELDGTVGSTSRQLTFLNRSVSMMYFRVKSGSAGPISIRIEAW